VIKSYKKFKNLLKNILLLTFWGAILHQFIKIKKVGVRAVDRGCIAHLIRLVHVRGIDRGRVVFNVTKC
jgi:hypothetical protein